MKRSRTLSPRFVLLLLSLMTAFALSSKSHAIESAPTIITNYSYPFDNQLIATLTGAVARASKPAQVVSVELRGDRRHVPLMDGPNKVVLHLYKQPKPAPLMFVIPGLGGSAGSGSALLLAENFFHAGYSVVTLPNNLSWQYTFAVSETGVPGYMPRDSEEYYQLLRSVDQFLQTHQGFRPTSYSITGVSLGGLLTTFLAQQDAEQKAFQFSHIILINPAVDIAYGIKVLDDLNAAGDSLTTKQKDALMGQAINLGEGLLKAPLSVNTFQEALPKISNFTEADLRWLIGTTFRRSIRDVIIAGQRVHNTGFIKSVETKNSRSAVLAEASQYTFADYMNLLVYPSLLGNKMTRGEVLAQSSMYSLASLLRSNRNIYVFENSDDLIIKKTDLEFLRQNLGSRLTVYPRGGHLGNLWWDQNKKDILKVATPAQ